tara:strand:- start:148 stop:1047 length:900 start_codon:yes stop_codon:yes gene_type:complete
MFDSLIKIVRPHHWVKNVIVFIPIFFSTHLLEFTVLFETFMVFISFCLVASSIYCLNDVIDREYDSTHPTKSLRPVASGLISVRHALVLSFSLLMFSLIIGYFISFFTIIVLFSYFVNNVLYSLFLKNYALIDVMMISFGFILRMLAGTTTIDDPLSEWIILTTFFLSLFLGFSKRFAELSSSLNSQSSNEIHKGKVVRKSLAFYSIESLDSMMVSLMSITIICYSLYTVSDTAYLKFGNNYLTFTIPFVVYCMFFYYNTVRVKNDVEDPMVELLSSKNILISGLLWIIACLIIILKLI